MTHLAAAALILGLMLPGDVSGQKDGDNAPVARAIGVLAINGRTIAEVPIAMRGSDIFVPRAVLDGAGLHWSSAAGLDLAGEPYVSLASLVPTVRFAFDEASAQLRLDAPAESFSAATDVAPPVGRDAQERPRPVSAFLNYAGTVSQGSQSRWSTELGVRAGHALVHTSVSGIALGTIGRGATSITIDDERRLVRWEAGDTVAVSTLSGQALSIAGMTVSRELGINPDFVPYLPLLMTGRTAVPATADVYINGQLTARVPVDPGTFQVKDFALPVGGGDVRVVVRDDFGRVQELTRNYYRSPSLLRPGLQEFRYSAGSPLASVGSVNWTYRGFVALGEHRVGVSEAVTLGASGGYSSDSAFAGASVAARLPVGEVEIDIRGSRARGQSGAAATALYLVRNRRLSVQSAVRVFSQDYEEVRPRSAALDPLADAAFSVTAILGRGVSAGVQYLWWHGRRETRQELGANLAISLPARLQLSLTAMRGTSRRRPVSAVATLTVALGSRSSASVSQEYAPSGASATRVSMQRSLPLGPGAGYQVQWQQGGASNGSAVAQYQTEWVRLEAREDAWGDRTAGSLNVSGAVVALRQGVFFTRPIDDAFALVRVPGIPNVRAYMSNQFVGRTNRHGDLVVPTLGSYQANRMAIDDRDLPMGVEAERIESIVAPALRGGGVVSFPARRTNASEADILRQLEALESTSSGSVAGADSHAPGLLITVQLDSSTAPTESESVAVAHWPTGDELTIAGSAGEFVFSRAVMGTHRVDVVGPRGSFTCTLTVPAASAAPIRLPRQIGPVPCQATGQR